MFNYLIMEDFAGEPATFIFPLRVEHADMRDQLPYARVVSCGTLELGPNGFICSGSCAELGISARPVEDAALIGRYMRAAQ